MNLQTPILGYQGLLAEEHLHDLLRDAGADREEVLRHHLELRRSRTSAVPRSTERLAILRQKVRLALIGYLTRLKRVKVGLSRSGNEGRDLCDIRDVSEPLGRFPRENTIAK